MSQDSATVSNNMRKIYSKDTFTQQKTRRTEVLRVSYV